MTLHPTQELPATASAGPYLSPAELADLQAERRLVHRVVKWMAILMPIGAGFFALLIFAAVRMAGVAAGAPVAMGAGLGVLAGFFFGMWAGVVASVSEMERE